MRDIVYEVPVRLYDSYRGRAIAIRSPGGRALADALPPDELGAVRFLRLTSLDEGPSALRAMPPGLPVELTLSEPAQAPGLYAWTELLETRPVRVTVPALPGCRNAVRLAAALHFEVKIDPRQPDDPMIAELLELVDFYLHHESVREPIEFFHGVLRVFCRGTGTTLWQIQDEDPAAFQVVADDGTLRPAGRLAHLSSAAPLEVQLNTFTAALFARGGECAECPFRAVCRGYFKAPDPGYACDGPKEIFSRLQRAAADLQRDVAEARQSPPPGG